MQIELLALGQSWLGAHKEGSHLRQVGARNSAAEALMCPLVGWSLAERVETRHGLTEC